MTPMKLAAGVVAAALTAGATAALAADLDYGRVPTDRYSSAYEDPRYRDLYAPEPKAYGYRVEPRGPVPPGYVYPPHSTQNGYQNGYRPHEAPRHGYADPRDGRYAANCLPREEVRRRLVEEGWRDFHDLEMRNGTAQVRARRPSGDLYDLSIDRCTGEVVNAQIVQRGGYGPYADDSSRRYYQRPYN